MPFGWFKKESKQSISVTVPVLCRVSQEDGVWTAVALDLPVVAQGECFDDATKNLHEALVAHCEAIQEHGDIELLISELQDSAKKHLIRVDEMQDNAPLVKMPVAFGERAMSHA